MKDEVKLIKIPKAAWEELWAVRRATGKPMGVVAQMAISQFVSSEEGLELIQAGRSGGAS